MGTTRYQHNKPNRSCTNRREACKANYECEDTSRSECRLRSPVSRYENTVGRIKRGVEKRGYRCKIRYDGATEREEVTGKYRRELEN